MVKLLAFVFGAEILRFYYFRARNIKGQLAFSASQQQLGNSASELLFPKNFFAT